MQVRLTVTFCDRHFSKSVIRNWFNFSDGHGDSIISVLSYILFKYQASNPLDAQIKRDVAATFSIFIMMGLPMIIEVARLTEFIMALIMNGTELNKLHEYNSGPMGLRTGHNENRHNFHVSLKEVMQTPEFISMSIYEALVMIPATLTLMCATLETEQTYYYLRYAEGMNEGSQLHAMGSNETWL